MKTPKLFFKISTFKGKKFLSPVKGQGSMLDSIHYSFRTYSTEKINNIIGFYNAYTLAFLENADDKLMYESDDYTYKNGLFRFFNINITENVDYNTIFNKNFDDTKEYISDKDKDSMVNSVFTNNKTILSQIISEHPCPSVENEGFYYNEDIWTMLIRNIKKVKNTLLTGPTGTGKTDIVMRICKELNIPCRVYDMGQMMDPITDLLGSHRLENGSSVFDYSRFVTDVQQPGVILLDELSRAPLMANNILFPCLDGRRTLPIDIADSNSDREIKIHPKCVFIATANIGNEYTGTQDLDIALENRFNIVQMDYLPASIEEKVLEIRTNIQGNVAHKIVTIVNSIRNLYNKGKISKSISTRETLECGELIADGFNLVTAINYSFLEKFPIRSEEHTIVSQILMGY